MWNGAYYYHVRSVIAVKNQPSTREVELKVHVKELTRAKRSVKALIDIVYSLTIDILHIKFVIN